MNTGVIKKKMEGKDFGFIKKDGAAEGDKDFFFHRSGVTDPAGFEGLQEGDKVSFDTEEDPKGRGMNAVNVKKA